MEELVVKIIGIGVVLWIALFFAVRRVLQKRSFGLCNRLLSSTHAFLAVVLASLSLEDWSCPVCLMASESSPQQMRTLAVSVSYLVYDLVCCQIDKTVKIDSTIHHLVSIVGLGAGLAYQRILFAVVFTVARMISGPYLAYVTLTANNAFLIKAMGLGLQLVSVFRFYKILRMVGYQLSKWASSSQSKNHPQQAKKLAMD